jgi:hypothetical protein
MQPNSNIPEILSPTHLRKSKGSVPLIRTAGQLLPDGSHLELVRDAETGQLSLLLFDGKNSTVARRLEICGKIYEPLQIDPSILSALTLPSICTEYGSTRDLYEDGFALISRTRYPENVVAPCTHFLFSTWGVDLMPRAPLLWIVVSPTASSEALRQILCILCRRAICLADPSTACLRSLPLELNPTIVTTISKVTRDVMRFLSASSRPDAFVAAHNKMIKAFFAKIVLTNEPCPDPEAVGFPLEIVLPPSHEYVPPMNSEEAARVAAEFQGKFLMYRLANRGRVTMPRIELDEFTAPTKALVHSLTGGIVGDEELQTRILPYLKPHDRQIQVDRSTQLESIVLESLLACHDSPPSDMPICDLTMRVNTILFGRGDLLEVSPEKVGRKLKALGFRTEFVNGGRKGLALSNETRQRIHDPAVAYGVRTIRESPSNPDCRFCAALALDTNTDCNVRRDIGATN